MKLDDPLNKEIERYCTDRGIVFKPYEYPPPWEISPSQDCPFSKGSVAVAWWPRAKRLRRAITRALREGK